MYILFAIAIISCSMERMQFIAPLGIKRIQERLQHVELMATGWNYIRVFILMKQYFLNNLCLKYF